MFNFNDPFFRPLWLRILLVGIIAVWTLIEILIGTPGWAVIWGALGVYTGYAFFFKFNLNDDDERDQ